jgi:hypothetical protein
MKKIFCIIYGLLFGIITLLTGKHYIYTAIDQYNQAEQEMRKIMIIREKIFLENFQSNDGTIKIPRVEKYKLLNEGYDKIIEKEIYNLIKANLLEQAKEMREEKSCYKYNHYRKVSTYCKNWSNIKHNDKDALVSLSCHAISEAMH